MTWLGWFLGSEKKGTLSIKVIPPRQENEKVSLGAGKISSLGRK